MKTSDIKGIIPAVVTPFTSKGELNEEGLGVILDYLIEKGVHGVFVAGSTGEFWTLTVEEKQRLFKKTVAAVRNRVPVYAGTCANNTSEAVHLSQIAEAEGVDCISVLTPFFISPTDDELYRHYSDIAQAVKLPVLLYGNPARTGVGLSTELVRRLAGSCENIVGIKDSTGDLTQSIDYMLRCGSGFQLVMGRDSLIYASLVHGAAGAIAASGNIAPEIAVGIYESFQAGNLQKALQLQKALTPLRLAFSLGSFPVVLKEGAQLVGLPAGLARPPVSPLTGENRDKLKRIIAELGVTVTS